MNLGAPEILVILVVALLVFGPHKLPEIGRQVGGAMRELRKVQDSVKSEIQSAMAEPAATYDKPVSAALPVADDAAPSITSADAAGVNPATTNGAGSTNGEAVPTAPRAEEPDHTEPPPAPGFEGPSGSFS
jgi:sec-independent protein translocase protein TatA